MALVSHNQIARRPRFEPFQGKEAARVLAIRGCTVVMCVRDKKRGDEAAAEIQAEVPAAKLNVMVLAPPALALPQNL